jgi:hypothetical protein
MYDFIKRDIVTSDRSCLVLYTYIELKSIPFTLQFYVAHRKQ